MTDSIWKRRHSIERARRDKLQEVMKEYDRTVYYPAMQQIMKDCFAEGHFEGKYHDNGFGWSWFYCSKCGGRYDIAGPDDQREPDCGANYD